MSALFIGRCSALDDPDFLSQRPPTTEENQTTRLRFIGTSRHGEHVGAPRGWRAECADSEAKYPHESPFRPPNPMKRDAVGCLMGGIPEPLRLEDGRRRAFIAEEGF